MAFGLDDFLELLFVHALLFEQALGNVVKQVPVFFQQGQDVGIALFHQAGNLLVDVLLRFLAVLADQFRFLRSQIATAALAEGHVPEFIAHAVVGNHALDDTRCPGDIVARPGTDFTKDNLLGGTASQHHVNLPDKLRAAVEELLVLAPLQGIAQSTHPAGDYRNLMHRIASRRKGRNEGVARLVIGNDMALLFLDDPALFLQADKGLFDRFVKVSGRHDLAAVADGKQGSFVDDICQIRTAHAARCMGKRIKVNGLIHLDVLGMNAQDCLTPLHVGLVDDNLPVKAARPQQGCIKDIGPVRRTQDDEALLVVKTVHLDEQLVERLLPLIVAAQIIHAALTDCIQLINEDDAGRLLARRTEEVADTACTDADEHLNEIGTGNAEEGNARLSCNGTCQQGLSRSGRADEQDALGNLAADVRILLGRLKEVNDFHQLLFCLIFTGNIGKAGLHLALVNGTRASAAGPEEGTAEAAAHLAENQPVHEENEAEGDDEVQQDLQQIGVLPGHELVFNLFLIEQVNEALHEDARRTVDLTVAGSLTLEQAEIAVKGTSLPGRRNRSVRTVADELAVLHFDPDNAAVLYQLPEFGKVNLPFGTRRGKQVQYAEYADNRNENAPKGHLAGAASLLPAVILFPVIFIDGQLEEVVGIKLILIIRLFIAVVAHKTSM